MSVFYNGCLCCYICILPVTLRIMTSIICCFNLSSDNNTFVSYLINNDIRLYLTSDCEDGDNQRQHHVPLHGWAAQGGMGEDGRGVTGEASRAGEAPTPLGRPALPAARPTTNPAAGKTTHFLLVAAETKYRFHSRLWIRWDIYYIHYEQIIIIRTNLIEIWNRKRQRKL